MPTPNDKLISLLAQTAANLDNQEKLALPVLANKLRKIAEVVPHDITVCSLATIFSKMEGNNKLFLSRGELKDLYKKTYVSGTKFAAYFAEELGNVQNQEQIIRTAASHKETTIDPFKGATDAVLSNALSNVFEKKAALKLFSNEVAEKAKKIVKSHLELWNLAPAFLNVPAGNESYLVVQADYETPKGRTSILVPVETSQNKVSYPSHFMSNSGAHELNYAALREYLLDNAGQKLMVSASDVLMALQTDFDAEASGMVTQALNKINQEKSVPFFGDTIIGQKMNKEAPPDVHLPQAGLFSSFAEKLENPLGYATLKFGKDLVNTGRDAIVRSLASFGIKNPQMNVSAANETSVIYSVSINGGRLAFNVPVKFASNRVLAPEFLICSGKILPFNQAGLRSLSLSNQKDHAAAASTSPQYGLKPNELIENVRLAMEEGNLEKAEDALNVISESKNLEAYKIAFEIYKNGLSLKKTASASSSKCSRTIKTASSQHPICGHTNLPLHKVYQDEHGNCHPLYRRDMAANYDGAYFMNSKVFG
jgi:hypothetical protein